MIANVCGLERRIRGIAGVIFIILGFVIGQAIGWIFGTVGLYLLFTAMLSYCLFNAMIGKNSCKVYVKDPIRDKEMTY